MRLGVDLGGTKIEVAALGSSGEELGRLRVDTPTGDYEAVLTAIASAVSLAEERWGAADTVGMGTPGAVDPTTGLLKNSNSTVLNGMPLPADVRSALGREVRIANDANCFALSEAADGAAEGTGTVFGVILGTGVGGGVVVDGKVLSGPNAIAGEWGHNPLPWPTVDERPGPECYCGRAGCIEKFLSGPGLTSDHRTATGRDMSPVAIAEEAGEGNQAARATLSRYVDRLARALATVINVVDPDVIVLGGGVSNIAALYTDVPAVWGDYVFSDSVLTSLVPAKHGDSSGVRGAARLWSDC